MLLHQQFVRMAKKNSKKMAIKDKTTKEALANVFTENIRSQFLKKP